MDNFKPFDDQSFKTWYNKVVGRGAVLAIALKFPSQTDFNYIGDAEVALKAWNETLNKKKRKSLDWMGNPSLVEKLCKPLSHMKQQDATIEAARVLRHFIGKTGQYGVGECYFWDHKIPVGALKTSIKALNKHKFNNVTVSLSDIVAWENLKLKSLGTKPKNANQIFKFNMSWTEFCLLVIEIGFVTLGLDPESHSRQVTEDLTKTNNKKSAESNDKNQEKNSKVVNMPLRPVLKNITSFSDIKDKSVFQILEIISPLNNKGVYMANISNSQVRV